MSAVSVAPSVAQQTAAEPARAADAWLAAPFDGAVAADVRALVAKLDVRQRAWLCGFLAGTLEPAGSTAPAATGPSPVVILYGSQSGNAEQLAHTLAARLA